MPRQTTPATPQKPPNPKPSPRNQGYFIGIPGFKTLAETLKFTMDSPPPVFFTVEDTYGHMLFSNVKDFLRAIARETPCRVGQIVDAFTHPIYQEETRKKLLQIRIYSTLKILEKNNIIEVETRMGDHNICYKLITFKNPV